MKILWAVCIMLVTISLQPVNMKQAAQDVTSQSVEPAQSQPLDPSAQTADADAQLLAATGSIYQTTTISQITSQHPTGPWGISGHVSVTGFVLTFARQVDGDFHVPFCDSPHFSSNGSFLPDKHHCVMAEVVPYLQCAVPAHLPSQQTIRGLLRYDGGPAAEWWEIHPIEFMTTGSCHVLGTPSVP
jgi:hypothetical protein